MAKQLASHCAFKNFDGKILTLSISPQQSNFMSPNLIMRVEQAVSEKLAHRIQLTILKNLNSENNFEDIKPTPHQINIEQKASLQKKAESDLEQDPVALFIQENFGAKLNPQSFKPKI